VTTDLARREGEKLALYLWENYIEPYAFPHGVFFIGAGHAFHAIAKLVSENGNVHGSLLGIVGFISTQPIRPVSSGTNHWVSSWYRENSLVFVSEKHSLWKKEKEGGKVSKRYGRLVKSPGEVLNGMMLLHREEVVKWMADRINQRKEAVGSTEEEDEDEGEDGDETKGEVDLDFDVDGDGDVGRNGQASDADTIDDPAVRAEGGSLDGNGSRNGPATGTLNSSFAAPGASPPAGSQLSRGDVVMTTEQ
jgi:hypothetical protein